MYRINIFNTLKQNIMAEIKIEQKNRFGWLLVGLIIVALLLYFLVFRDSENRTVTEEDYNTDRISLQG
jgi:hypothetical protein